MAQRETIESTELRRRLGEGAGFVALFVADWCGHCQRLRAELDRGPRTGLPIVEVDISEDDDPAWDEWRVELVPTAVLFRGGREAGRRTASFRGLPLGEVADLAVVC
jgi:thiol-disulfide isomerase/thioredoxin